MPNAADHQTDELFRILYVGNSGAGKTGSLESLVAMGYKLRIIDFDNGLGILFNFVKKNCPNLLNTIEYQSYRNKTKMSNQGPVVKGSPTAYTAANKALDLWPEDQSDPSTWGSEYIVVIDSLTSLSREAMLWAKAMNPTSKDPRQWYSAAQSVIEDFIATLTSPDFGTNVIVLTHIELPAKDGTDLKSYPSAIGKALGPKLPRYFNTVVLAESKGTGTNVKRVIKTSSTPNLDLKTEAPMNMDTEYPLETGLASLVKALKV